MHTNDKNHINPGIACEATNCTYNINGSQCTAAKIQVTPKQAKASEETDCATFIKK